MTTDMSCSCNIDSHAGVQVDPVEDTDVINFELALADIGQIEKRQERLRKGRAKTKEEEAEQQVVARAHSCHAWDTHGLMLLYSS